MLTDRSQVTSISPFPSQYRASGLLLHFTSLPSPYGIGDLGPGAYAWIDQLHEAGQTWWQALPLGPTGYGDSPYQLLSSFVGNGLLISPELLVQDGLLRADESKQAFSSTTIDYDVVIPFKHRLLKTAWARFRAGIRKDLREGYEEFCQERTEWLEDYALFRALKAKYGNVPYFEWPKNLVKRTPSVLTQARQELADEIDQVRLAQFLLFRQGKKLKEYAHAKGVQLIGDLPFFVSPDSSDVWAHPQLFLLDDTYRPLFVAGVPSDYFNIQGQLWGNPVYDWEVLRSTGYDWCIARIRALLAHVDVIRLDHFRAFAAAWHIPAEAPTAETGEWVPGPGADFFAAVRNSLGGLPFIAEDLGMITADVSALLDKLQVPRTRVLQFAFDGNADNIHLPDHYSENTVVYTGTHDNTTSRDWYQALPFVEKRQVWRYLKRSEGQIQDVAPELIRLAWSSAAAVAIAPLQDLLNLGQEGRMNIPGSAEGNWRWRAKAHMLSAGNFHWLGDLTATSNRSARGRAPVLGVAS